MWCNNMAIVKNTDFLCVKACIFKRHKVIGRRDTFLRISYINEFFDTKIDGVSFCCFSLSDGTFIYVGDVTADDIALAMKDGGGTCF